MCQKFQMIDRSGRYEQKAPVLTALNKCRRRFLSCCCTAFTAAAMLFRTLIRALSVADATARDRPLRWYPFLDSEWANLS